MKYIVLPPLKFIWAIIATILFAIIDMFLLIVYTIWTLKSPWHKDAIGIFYFHTYINSDRQLQFSPYYTRNKNNFADIKFKSVYHYIWGIHLKHQHYV